MATFRNQIMEDLKEYKENYPMVNNIEKEEWAFNYWVLDKLFSEDEDLIEEKIVDYNDKGIDCFVWHEDLMDLYIIQNKYYSDTSKLTANYITDFLTRPISHLKAGKYSRSKELQDIYNKYCNEEDFHIYFNLYVTNDLCKTDDNMAIIEKFNQDNSVYSASLYSLRDIEDLYYKKPKTNKTPLSFEIKTINDGTTLNINTQAYIWHRF